MDSYERALGHLEAEIKALDKILSEQHCAIDRLFDRLDRIEKKLDRSSGFIGGVAFVATALGSAATYMFTGWR